MIYNQLGEEKKALDCGNQALSLARAARNREVEAAAVTTLGVVHNNFGDKKTAIEYFDAALLLMREVQDRTGEANTLNYLGRAHFRSGQNRKAVAYLHQALEVVAKYRTAAWRRTSWAISDRSTSSWGTINNPWITISRRS